MKLHALNLRPFLFASALLASVSVSAAGCSSSSGNGGAPSVFCSTSFGGTQNCYGYSNLTSSQESTVQSECTQQLSGTVVSACPTSNLAGCCTYTEAGIETEECFYDSNGVDETSAGQTVCSTENGKWSATSSGGSGNGSSGGSGNGSSSGGGNGSSSGGGSGSSSGGSTGSTFCSSSTFGTTICYGYTNVPASEEQSLESSCTTSLGGTVVSSCPTSGLAGCCTYSQAGYTTEECFYDATGAEAGQEECGSEGGTWSQTK